MLSRLKLAGIRDQLDSLLDEAARADLDMRQTLTLLCEREIARKAGVPPGRDAAVSCRSDAVGTGTAARADSGGHAAFCPGRSEPESGDTVDACAGGIHR